MMAFQTLGPISSALNLSRSLSLVHVAYTLGKLKTQDILSDLMLLDVVASFLLGHNPHGRGQEMLLESLSHCPFQVKEAIQEMSEARQRCGVHSFEIVVQLHYAFQDSWLLEDV